MWNQTFLSLLVTCLVISASGQTTWTLEQCVAEAERNNLTIRDQALQLEIAKLNNEQAKGAFLPTLNGFATHGYNWGRVIDPFTNTFATDRVRTNNLALQADMDLFQGFRNQRTLEQSNLDIEASEEAIEAARIQLRTAVVDNFLNVLDVNERLKVARIQVGRTDDQRQNLQVQIDAGNRPRVDLLDLDAQRAQEQFTVTDLEVQLDRNKLTLIQLLQLKGVSIADFEISAPDITQVEVAPTDVLFSDVLAAARENFPAYRQAVLNEQSAALSTKIAEAGRYPSLTLSGS